MERELKRQQRTVGAVVKIPLEGGFHSYARILETRMAFYDARTREDLAIDEIVKKPVLFIVIVEDYVINQAYWLKIGKKLPIEAHLLEFKPFYTEDIFTGKHHIVVGIEQIEVSKEEIKGLESFTWWTHVGIEKRLNDHFANRRNERVEAIKSGTPATSMFQRAIRRKEELAKQKELQL